MNELPGITTKGQLYKKYYQISTAVMREIINEIIARERKIPLDDAKHMRTVYKNECRLVMIEIGEVEDDRG